MKATIILMVVISVAQLEVYANVARDQRSFPWSSLISGNSVTSASNIPKADASYGNSNEVNQQFQQKSWNNQQAFLHQLHQQDIHYIQQMQQQAYPTPRFTSQQQLAYNSNIPYHLSPISKYDGIDLKPNLVSLQLYNLQQSLFTDKSPVYHPDSASPVQPSGMHAKKIEFDLPASLNRVEQTIPAELHKLAFSLGIRDLSKLPSLDDAMNLLGATSPEETISIIKELASTENGREMIKQFMQTSEDNTDVEKERGEQHLERQLEQNQLHLTEQHRHQYQKQPHVLQQPQPQHHRKRQIDNHQNFYPRDVAPHSYSGPTFSTFYGSPNMRHQNQLLQMPIRRPQHANTDHGFINNVVKPDKPSGGFIQAITDFFLPPSAVVDLNKSADASTVIPAQTISDSSFASSYHHPTFRAQQQQHFHTQDQSVQQLEPRHPVTNPSMRTNPIKIQAKTVTSQNGNESQPDISTLTLGNYTASMSASQAVTTYGTPVPQYSVGDDLNGSASVQITAAVREPISNEVEPQESVERNAWHMVNGKNEIGFHLSGEEPGIFNQRRISNKPQRISSYDSYASGKINRADAEAMRVAIPTQTPPLIL